MQAPSWMKHKDEVFIGETVEHLKSTLFQLNKIYGSRNFLLLHSVNTFFLSRPAQVLRWLVLIMKKKKKSYVWLRYNNSAGYTSFSISSGMFVL